RCDPPRGAGEARKKRLRTCGSAKAVATADAGSVIRALYAAVVIDANRPRRITVMRPAAAATGFRQARLRRHVVRRPSAPPAAERDRPPHSRGTAARPWRRPRG